MQNKNILRPVPSAAPPQRIYQAKVYIELTNGETSFRSREIVSHLLENLKPRRPDYARVLFSAAIAALAGLWETDGEVVTVTFPAGTGKGNCRTGCDSFLLLYHYLLCPCAVAKRFLCPS